MRVVMTIANGPYEGRTALLQTGQSITVGRTEYADFCVPHDDRISGVHFALDCERSRCVVRDLESTNGTTVNGTPVPEAELEDGDVIVAGRTKFKVTVEVTESMVDFEAIRLAETTDQAAIEREQAPEATASSSNEVSAADSAVSGASELVLPERPSTESLDSAAFYTVADTPPLSPALMLASGSERPYVAGLQDADPAVRREALHAAAWSGETWLLDYCRNLAREPQAEQWEALCLLAVLGEPSDLNLILKIGRSVALGSRRFQIYASYGHPRTVRDLLMAIENSDPKIAVAAGVAFCKITGAEIDAEEQAELPPDASSESDEDASELEEALLPSAPLAREHWSRVKDSFAAGTRWRRGLNLSDNGGVEFLDQLDMEARWELGLRRAHRGLPSRQCLPPMLQQSEPT